MSPKKFFADHDFTLAVNVVTPYLRHKLIREDMKNNDFLSSQSKELVI